MSRIQPFPSDQNLTPAMRRFLQSINTEQARAINDLDIASEKIHLIEQEIIDLQLLLTGYSNDGLGNIFIDAPGTFRIGNAAGYADFANDGTLTLAGTATVFKDELGKLASAKLISPGGNLVQDDAEGSYYFKSTATTSDYLWTNIQLNHDRKNGADIMVHIHWWQTSSTIPNWLVQYRYQDQGASKTTAWTSIKYLSHAFSYTSGTLNQKTAFPAITPPSGSGISDILQIRLIRDTGNSSGLFSGADGLASDVYLVDADVHKECDSLGSSQEYVK